MVPGEFWLFQQVVQAVQVRFLIGLLVLGMEHFDHGVANFFLILIEKQIAFLNNGVRLSVKSFVQLSRHAVEFKLSNGSIKTDQLLSNTRAAHDEHRQSQAFLQHHQFQMMVSCADLFRLSDDGNIVYPLGYQTGCQRQPIFHFLFYLVKQVVDKKLVSNWHPSILDTLHIVPVAFV